MYRQNIGTVIGFWNQMVYLPSTILLGLLVGMVDGYRYLSRYIGLFYSIVSYVERCGFNIVIEMSVNVIYWVNRNHQVLYNAMYKLNPVKINMEQSQVSRDDIMYVHVFLLNYIYTYCLTLLSIYCTSESLILYLLIFMYKSRYRQVLGTCQRV